MGDLIKGNILLLSNSALSALTSLGAFLYIWLNLKTKPMKRILLAALMIGTHFATAQEEIDTYEMSRFEKEPYVIQANAPENGNYSFYINMQSLDASIDNGGIIVKSKYLEDFRVLLKECQVKLNEWDEVANANGVADLTKDIPVTVRPKLTGFFRYGDWKFDYNVVLMPKYFRSSNEAQVILYTGEMTASDNEYMDAENFVFAFNSDEIAEFLEKLTTENVENHFTKKASKEELFK